MEIKNLKKEIPYQWRIQSFSKNKPEASCVAYIDARDAMDLLDEVVGEYNWQDDYRLINNQLFAGVGIYINDQWVWKWDTGTESQAEKEKGLVSDSFKRACVKWGIGRFLYNLPIQYIATDAIKEDQYTTKDSNKKYSKYPNPVDSSGKRIYDITAYINNSINSNKIQLMPQETLGEAICPQCSQSASKLEGKYGPYIKCENCHKNFSIK